MLSSSHKVLEGQEDCLYQHNMGQNLENRGCHSNKTFLPAVSHVCVDIAAQVLRLFFGLGPGLPYASVDTTYTWAEPRPSLG